MDEAASGHLAASGKLLELSVPDDAGDNTGPHFTFGDLAAHAASLGSDDEAEACGEVVVAGETDARTTSISVHNPNRWIHPEPQIQFPFEGVKLLTHRSEMDSYFWE